jgi:tyrosyl-tRNA synthetase
MGNVIDELRERGFVEQTTHDQELYDYIDQGNITCYIGFDPTASSLHIGNLVPIMSLAHMQRYGHRPIALVGGGTGLVGDPSGKTEMRKLLTPETLEENAMGIKQQLSHFLDFSDGKAIMLNNADWLTKLGYISFLRDVGRHFSVNRMIKAESCKISLCRPMTFWSYTEARDAGFRWAAVISGATSWPGLSSYAEWSSRQPLASPSL